MSDSTPMSPRLVPLLIDHPFARGVQWVAAGVVATVVLLDLYGWEAPIGVLVQGMLIGALTALISLGLSLVYRANRVINFAQADLGSAPAVFGVLMVTAWDVPYLVAIPVALVLGALTGALVQVTVVRRFRNAPRLTLTVATIALAQVLGAIAFILPLVIEQKTRQLVAPFDLRLEIAPIIFRANDVIAVLMGPAMIVALIYFFQRTRVGAAVRASAGSSERASLLGIPVRRVETLVWLLAAVLSTAAVILRAGSLGLPLGSLLGPSLLLRALAAAVIGRMERMGVIVAAALGLGMLETVVFWNTSSELIDPIVFLVLMATLLIQRGGGATRLANAAISSWRAVTPVRPIPPELLAVGEVRWSLRGFLGMLLAFGLGLPLLLSDPDTGLVAGIFLFAIVGVSLVLLTGWAGELSLGQVAFFAIGAAVGGALTSRMGWELSLAIIASGTVGAVVAGLIGLPAIRVRGLFLAVSSLALALATGSYVINRNFFDWWLPPRRIERPPLFGQIDISSETRFYYFALVCLLLAIAAANGIRRSRAGRVMIAVRDNERSAQSYGIDLLRTKLTAFITSGFMAAAAGAVFVHHQQNLTFNAFQPEQSLRAFTMIVIGGLGSVPGAVLGAGYIRGVDWFLPRFLPPEFEFFASLLASGLGLLIVLSVLPGGLGGLMYSLRDRWLRWVAGRHGIHVPSLVADSAGPDSFVGPAGAADAVTGDASTHNAEPDATVSPGGVAVGTAAEGASG